MFEEIYDAWSDNYHRFYRSFEDGVNEASCLVQSGVSAYLRSGSLLELGCGIGIVSRALLNAGFTIKGIDLSARSIEKAKGHNSVDRASFENFNVLDYHQTKQYDGVLAVGDFLTHFLDRSDRLEVVRRMFDWTKPGGYLILSCDDYDQLLEFSPEDLIETPRSVNGPEQTGFVLRRRIWSGSPREHIYTCIYYLLIDNMTPVIIAMKRYAIPKDEIFEMLHASGFEKPAIHSVSQTGYYQPIYVSRRPL